MNGSHVIYEPYQITFYLSLAILGGIIASLATRKPNKEKIQLYHDLISTPVKEDEIILKPCTLPEGTVPPSRKKWFSNTSFEICAPSKISYAGFILSWVAVALMVLAFIYIIQP